MFNLKEQQLLDKDFKETIWGSELLKDLEEETKNDIEILKDVAQTLENDSDLELFYQTIQSDINQIKTLQNNLKTWDKAYETSKYITLIDWPRKRIKSEIKDEAKKMRDMVKANFNDRRGKILIANSKDSAQDLYNMYKKLVELENLINEFDKKFSAKKKRKKHS